jgi:choline monooxygenase
MKAEDTFICESVQRGLLSSGYDVGRYAPKVESADHNFHLKLASMYRKYLEMA